MLVRRLRPIALAIAFATCLTACKPGGGGLAAGGARDALASSVFAHGVQQLAFTTGARSATPLAMDGFLYAKHWLVCQAAQPGLFSTTTTCTFDAAGRTYARANGWIASHAAGSCEACETWTVPLAKPALESVTRVTSTDATHAVAEFAYRVVPNAFGGELGDWMTRNAQAWCGPDPRAIGGWNTVRHGTAAFTKSGGTWQPSAPAASFAAFAIPTQDRPCSAV